MSNIKQRQPWPWKTEHLAVESSCISSKPSSFSAIALHVQPKACNDFNGPTNQWSLSFSFTFLPGIAELAEFGGVANFSEDCF